MATIRVSEGTQHVPSYTSNQVDDSDEFFDSTPYHANMSKRRHRYSEIQREDNTQSRVNKIKNIFEETTSDVVPLSSSFRNISQQVDDFKPPITSSSNRAIRLSVHKADSDYLINSSRMTCQTALSRPQSFHSHSTKHTLGPVPSSPLRSSGKPLSSGHNTPSRIPRPVRDLSTIKLTAGFTYGEDSDDEDVHSTHGVPLILPIRGKEVDFQQKASTVSRWLQTVEYPMFNENSKITGISSGERAGSSMLAIKDKESCYPRDGPINHRAVKNRLSPGPVRSASTTTSPHKLNFDHVSNKSTKELPQYAQANNNAFSTKTPPTGLLLMPPRRIGQTQGILMPSRNVDISRQVKSLCRKPKDQQIEDTRCHSAPSNKLVQDDNIVELSPSVNRDRRHRGLGQDGSPSMKQAPKNSSTNIEIADLILSLEAHEREEEEQRSRNMNKFEK